MKVKATIEEKRYMMHRTTTQACICQEWKSLELYVCICLMVHDQAHTGTAAMKTGCQLKLSEFGYPVCNCRNNCVGSISLIKLSDNNVPVL